MSMRFLSISGPIPRPVSGADTASRAHTRLPAAADGAPEQPLGMLEAELLARWRGRGAPRRVLAKAAQVDRQFRTRHAAVRHDRELVANIAFLVAAIGALGIATIGITLAELHIGAGEFAARMVVLGLLIGACGSLAMRGGNRLPVQLAVLGTCVAILVSGPPGDYALRGWDKTSVLIGTALILGKAVRLFVDRMLDRHEARLLLASAGCR